jgi:deoxyribonuclease-4
MDDTYGIHIRGKKKLELKQAFKYAKTVGCKYVQMFNENIENPTYIKKKLKDYDLKLIVHSPYIINIASPFDPKSWKMKYLLIEIENSVKNGAIGIVIHMGKSLDLPVKQAYNNMFQNLKYACSRKPQKFIIYLETTAGQGTELCYNITDLGDFYNRIKNVSFMKSVKICLDTCHIFCAGYDIRNKKSIEKFLKEFDLVVGINNIGLIHLNDSLNDLGTNLDRHTNIGQGYIGSLGLKIFYKFFAKMKIPAILETPPEHILNDVKIITS